MTTYTVKQKAAEADGVIFLKSETQVKEIEIEVTPGYIKGQLQAAQNRKDNLLSELSAVRAEIAQLVALYKTLSKEAEKHLRPETPAGDG